VGLFGGARAELVAPTGANDLRRHEVRDHVRARRPTWARTIFVGTKSATAYELVAPRGRERSSSARSPRPRTSSSPHVGANDLRRHEVRVHVRARRRTWARTILFGAKSDSARVASFTWVGMTFSASATSTRAMESAECSPKRE
jgi:hypothetical protein